MYVIKKYGMYINMYYACALAGSQNSRKKIFIYRQEGYFHAKNITP